MINRENIFTVISVTFGFLLFLPYFIGLFKKTIKPHVFSWLTWAILTGTGFIFSFTNGGGGGSFTFGVQSVLCVAVVIWAIFRGEKNITKSDWLVLGAICLTFVVYLLTKNPTLSVILVASIDFMGYIPTFRKSYRKPYDESSLTYSFAFLSFFFSLGALQSHTLVTAFYPTILLVANSALVIFLLIRRQVIKKTIN